jgi:hypothetical protein
LLLDGVGNLALHVWAQLAEVPIVDAGGQRVQGPRGHVSAANRHRLDGLGAKEPVKERHLQLLL